VQEIEELFAKLDADKNCKIDYWEFRKLLDALDSSD
jgi:Ca2+-binding EF-hand superfamily protein